MNLPKTIKIGADIFKVVEDKNSIGADFSYDTHILTIGTKITTREHLLNIITHEIFEMWAVTLYIRYTRPDTFKTYEFHFDHRQFTNWIELASQSVAEFKL